MDPVLQTSPEKPGNGASKDTGSLEQIRAFLQAKDDTSRFVGLALLKAILDNDKVTLGSVELISLFEAIPSRFLDRLLRPQASQKLEKVEAQRMVDLAVSVLHKFSIILPEDCCKRVGFTDRIEPLVKALLHWYGSLSTSPLGSNVILVVR